MTKVALVFPGQGSQFVGMGQALYAGSATARGIFDRADELLGIPLSTLCFEGPATELEETVNAQPAILTASVAILEAVREAAASTGTPLDPVVVAGHSLGEFTALVAAGAIDFADALGLVRERGRLMKQAGDEQPGGMAAVIGLDAGSLADVCLEAGHDGIVVVANDNCPGQTVISGEVGALTRAMELAKERGAKRVARLGISIASHSPLMAQASSQFGELIASVQLRTPRVPVVGNSRGEAIATIDGLREELMSHIERPVQWTRSVQEMIAMGVDTFIEVGPGQVLSGLIKRISRDVSIIAVDDLELGLPVINRERAARGV
jgi:[acyl-carrier-protein] S-malonyltransferase